MPYSRSSSGHCDFSIGEQNPIPNLRHAEKFGAEPLREANIASHLGPRADAHIEEGAHLRVVGFDGYSIDLDTYEWRPKWLHGWLTGTVDDVPSRAKMDVDYLIQEPVQGVVEKLRQFAAELPPNAGRLRIFVPRSDRTANVPSHWKTFHFAVFEHHPQLWIEKNHPPKTTDAFDCYYFRPEAAVDEPLYYSCLREFDDVVAAACEVVVDSRR